MRLQVSSNIICVVDVIRVHLICPLTYDKVVFINCVLHVYSEEIIKFLVEFVGFFAYYSHDCCQLQETEIILRFPQVCDLLANHYECSILRVVECLYNPFLVLLMSLRLIMYNAPRLNHNQLSSIRKTELEVWIIPLSFHFMNVDSGLGMQRIRIRRVSCYI